ncbi:MAG: RuBisCO large subunit C-terminal-like domain-containing protein [Archangium sp.]
MVGKLEGDPLTTQGYYNVCRDSYTRQDLPRGVYFDQDWADLKKVLPVASVRVSRCSLRFGPSSFMPTMTARPINVSP